MSSTNRLVAAVLLVAATSIGIVTAATAAFMRFSGTVDIEVHERNGTDVTLTIPASVLQAAVACLPVQTMLLEDADAARWLALAESLLARVEAIPDAVLVEVDEGAQHVRVEKRDGKLTVHVRTEDEEVRVGVPLSLARQVFAKFRATRVVRVA